MAKLSGRTALVTGGGQGVGLGIARRFASEGASLVLTGRNLDKLRGVVAELESRGAKVEVCVADVRLRADAERSVAFAIERFGALDILVNNAQTTTPGVALVDSSDDIIRSTVESGLYGTIHHMQAALPHMRERGGSIINLGSRQGMYGAPGYGIYAATKEAIRGLSRAAAREWGQFGIRVNVICPAALSPAAQKFQVDFPEEWARNLQQISLRRLGDPEQDIGPVALFLASEDSRYVTGQTINADGGMQML